MNLSDQAIGIDIGGTKIAVGLVNRDGSIVRRMSIATEASGDFPTALGRIADAIEATIESDACGIGIGCAGPVDPVRGVICNPYTLPGWGTPDIVSALRNRFDTPVYLENDADAALLGECLFGAGRGCEPVVMLTFGTGIGGAVWASGQIQRGAGGQHPELGHMVVNSSGPECYCGTRGCLESLASGTAIAAAGQAIGLENAQAVFAKAKAGNAKARSILDVAATAIATAAWSICHMILPQRLVLGGGIMDQHFALFAPVVEQRLRAATQFDGDMVEIVPAALGNDAGIVGAAGLVFSPRPLTTQPSLQS